MQQTIDYLKKLTSIPSPTGFTREVADYLVEELERLGLLEKLEHLEKLKHLEESERKLQLLRPTLVL